MVILVRNASAIGSFCRTGHDEICRSTRENGPTLPDRAIRNVA